MVLLYVVAGWKEVGTGARQGKYGYGHGYEYEYEYEHGKWV